MTRAAGIRGRRLGAYAAGAGLTAALVAFGLGAGANGPPALDIPILGFGGDADLATARAALGAAIARRFEDLAYAYGDDGAWYAQSFETEFGAVVVEGHGDRATLEALKRFDLPPAALASPDIRFAGDDYTGVWTEASAGFEISGVNYRVTLNCDPDGRYPLACNDDRAVRALVKGLRVLKERKGR